MHKRLYIEYVLFENQFGFRKNNSTSYALMEITENIKESIDNGKKHLIQLIIHSILFKKLEHYGVRNSSRLV